MFFFAPRNLGKMIPILTSIFFQRGLVQPPISIGFMYGTEYLPTCMVDFYGFHVGTYYQSHGNPMDPFANLPKKRTKNLWTPADLFFVRSEAGMGGGSSNAATAFFGWEISGVKFRRI